MAAKQSTWIGQFLEPRTIITIAVLLVGVVGAAYAVKAHCSDVSVHHTPAELDAAYVRRDVQEVQMDGIERRLAAIEAKLERIEEKLDAMQGEKDR